MNRRTFICGGAAAFLISQAGCKMDTTPQPLVSGGVQTAQVNIQQLFQSVTQQQCEEWCWAACISMIFSFYGHPLNQQAIVAATYGNVICLPANSTTTIGRDLSRPYIDDRGVPFISRVISAYDFFNRINTFSNQSIIDALNSNNPLLYCNKQHAMIVFSANYIQTATGPNVQSVQVVDPWPFNPRTHVLTPAEMVVADAGGEMTFLAEVQIT